MAIEKVIIQNFKKFKNPFEVKFNENINLLVGDNESGKSTILEAIHVALTGMYAGRNIRNQLSTYLFNREAVEEYLNERYDKVPHYSKYVWEFIEEYPRGTYLVTMPGHITVIKNGTLYDTFDCRNRRMWNAWKTN